MKIRNKEDFKTSFLNICFGKSYLRRVKEIRLFLNTDKFKNEFMYVKDNSKVLLECLEEVKPLLSQVCVGTYSNGGEYPSDVYDYCITFKSDIDEICNVTNKHLERVHFGYKNPLTKEYIIDKLKG